MLRPLVAALALLAPALAACEAEPSVGGDDMMMTERPEPYDQLADNVCGEQAWCKISECGPMWTPDLGQELSDCMSMGTPCPEAGLAYVECVEACDASCPESEPGCEDIAVSGGIFQRCGLDGFGFTEDDCLESLSWCDDVQDPPSA